jgi:hypothetical protein
MLICYDRNVWRIWSDNKCDVTFSSCAVEIMCVVTVETTVRQSVDFSITTRYQRTNCKDARQFRDFSKVSEKYSIAFCKRKLSSVGEGAPWNLRKLSMLECRTNEADIGFINKRMWMWYFENRCTVNTVTIFVSTLIFLHCKVGVDIAICCCVFDSFNDYWYNYAWAVVFHVKGHRCY